MRMLKGDFLCLKEEETPPASFMEVLSWNAPEWYFMVFGCLGCMIEGGAQPAFAVVFTKVLSVSKPTSGHLQSSNCSDSES